MIIQDLLTALKKFPLNAELTLAVEEYGTDYDDEGHDIETVELVAPYDYELILLADDVEVARLGG
jgi:hypothetical protein